MSHKHERGAILLTLLLGMVFLAAAGAAMAPMLSTSVEDQAIMSQGSQAFYVAESGYSLAANRFLHAKDGDKNSALAKLHNTTFRFKKAGDSQPTFSLAVYPRWLTVRGSTGAAVTAQVFGGLDTEFIDSARTFYCPQTGQTYTPRSFNTSTRLAEARSSTNTHSFTLQLDTQGHGLSQGDDLLPAALPSSRIIKKNASLQLSTGAQAFPQYGGVFRVQGLEGAWTYTKREENTLTNIRSAAAPTKTFEPVTIPDNTHVFLDKFVAVESTGTTRFGSYTLRYAVPIGWTYESSEAPKEVVLYENFKDDTGGFSSDGTPRPYTSEGKLKLQQKGEVLYSPRDNTLSYANIKKANNGCLNYDAQVKIGFNLNNTNQIKNIFTGLSFRLSNGNGNYGFSLIGDNVLKDFLNNPGSLTRNTLYLVLWKKTGNRYSVIACDEWSEPYFLTNFWGFRTYFTPNGMALAVRVTEGYAAHFSLQSGQSMPTTGTTLSWNGGKAKLAREPAYSQGYFYMTDSPRAGELLMTLPSGTQIPQGTVTAKFHTPEGDSGTLILSNTSSTKTNVVDCFYGTQYSSTRVNWAPWSIYLWTGRTRYKYPYGTLTWPKENWIDRGEIVYDYWGRLLGFQRSPTHFTPLRFHTEILPAHYVNTTEPQYLTLLDSLSYTSGTSQSQEVGIHNYSHFGPGRVSFDDFSIRATARPGSQSSGFTAPIVISQ
ncbi:hypothetical protein [Desulfobaculum bizertense]|uniref:Uncharacterized protein n=1 Tax=Desulfobaculum bizertense DSM 18034 TaxID=1121442 RepID=A0A1T4VHB8_9BACT|nr:hypothetical protein [Desulfobaculum bizertense]SKA64329.1 hypothetical protein SAMN02745702_00311 [Desulfobaculum bizertense DSM 18034]